MNVLVVHRGTVQADDIEAACFELADELAEKYDPGVICNSKTGEIEINVVVESEDLVEGSAKGSAIIRSALHAAGFSTVGFSAGRPVFTATAITSTDALVDA